MAALLAHVAPAEAQTPAAFNPAPLQADAQSGNVTAEFQLGTLDYVGLTVVQDYIGAVDLLKQAGNAGNAEAQCEVGFLYQTGSFAQGPPPPDPADAAHWYEKSAALGDPWGEFALAALYQAGQGVPKDAAKAAVLFAQAAAQGVTADPASFPLAQLQTHFYEIAYQLTGETKWTDTVSIAAGGGQ
jgi:TPR repeat protein